MTFTIHNMKHDTYRDGFGGEVPMITAEVKMGEATLFVSQREDDEDRTGWGVDAAFIGGVPSWSNGAGARYLTVHRPNVEIEQVLNRWARQM